MFKGLCAGLVAVILGLSASSTVFGQENSVALAQAKSAKTGEALQPYEVVEQVTADMMAVIKTGAESLKEKPDEYFAEIRASLEPTVSFSYIAKNVMAGHWDKASEEQQRKFTETFTRSMVETLGKGMAHYSDLDINTLPSEGDAASSRRVEVVQEIQATDGTSRVAYTMAQNKSGEWKLINVVLNGVNLGKSFRDQFAQAMKQNEGNIDKVIADWAAQA